MTLLDKAAISQMTAEQLREYMTKVCLTQQEYVKLDKLRNSTLGEYILERLKARQVAAMNGYRKIKINGQTDRDIVVALVEALVADRLVSAEINDIEEAVQNTKALDAHKAMCDAILIAKEKSEKTAR